MKESLTREEMRELDRKAIEEYKIPGLILMENAGRNVAEEVLKMTDDPQRTKVAILCGKGNNGGDGYVVARHLHNHHVPVDVFLVANISDILKDGDAGTNLQILLPMKIPIREILGITEIASVLKELGSYDIIIDALFGTGLSGEVRQPFKTLIEGVNNLNKPIVSVDIPSGLDCNNGNILGAAMKATKTVTFAASKRGFYLGNGPVHTGKIIITDISIPKELLP
ncbi:MAG: NAD(P)H-hydrate epimerase [Candidatus Brocadia sp. AMX2]|uniref:NAD(P)H-hydrate epimerase n=1 Tax=Candidatus Brocadia sinica JPN1 TaxID=1197129 RepID=A0ABQ0K2Y1_9BACT|nr:MULTISPECIES: NAD(P)H-hydrate epimerase [Brocadia]KXK27681.1 MAG: carbohydrate kinase [Candidatus Brocadia sinica]MBC6931531.1 NAD(P)H-hydrate epimerase [Candidatus Brocadia sp.]NOG42905.1 NAD(P)H-hydrate epimerase [Planctomycetota bacterium]KAA0242523.1 MAG: NAD(P)H-hydrate epimerase [Candidatus Brocadia sp. AMX2]MCE7866238.1 NAD(P)H-hydrate epimerase [Candidatus Brocadia sp. AMX2]